jgi:hypothetical protein
MRTRRGCLGATRVWAGAASKICRARWAGISSAASAARAVSLSTVIRQTTLQMWSSSAGPCVLRQVLECPGALGKSLRRVRAGSVAPNPLKAKRQRTTAFQDAGAQAKGPARSARSWSAPAPWRFGQGHLADKGVGDCSTTVGGKAAGGSRTPRRWRDCGGAATVRHAGRYLGIIMSTPDGTRSAAARPPLRCSRSSWPADQTPGPCQIGWTRCPA